MDDDKRAYLWYRGLQKDEDTPAITYCARRPVSRSDAELDGTSMFLEFTHGDWYPHKFVPDSASETDRVNSFDVKCLHRIGQGELVMLPNPADGEIPQGIPRATCANRLGKSNAVSDFVFLAKLICYPEPPTVTIGGSVLPTYDVVSRIMYKRLLGNGFWYLCTRTRVFVHNGAVYNTGTASFTRFSSTVAIAAQYTQVLTQAREGASGVYALNGYESDIKSGILSVHDDLVQQKEAKALNETADARREFDRLRAIDRKVLTDTEYAERMRLQRMLTRKGLLP